jgi:uncharacterized protein Veg
MKVLGPPGPEVYSPTGSDSTSSFLNDADVKNYIRRSRSGYGTSGSPLQGPSRIDYGVDKNIDTEVYKLAFEDASFGTNGRSFNVRPIEHTGALARELLERNSREKLETPKELMEVCIKYRSLYLKTDRQIDLQYSMMAGKLSLYSNLVREMDPILSPRQYFDHAARYGYTFANVLKKAKSLATLLTLSKYRLIDLIKKVDEFNDRYGHIVVIDKDKKYAYDDFLNEDNLIFFNDPTVNDLEWAYEPLEIDEGALSRFREVLLEVLEQWKVHNLESPGKAEFSTWTSDSTSFEASPKDRTIHRSIVRDRIIQGHKNPFGVLTKNFRMRRSIIPVAPANFRDSWEPNFDTLFTIKSISHVMRPIVQNIPYSAMYDPNIAHRRKKRLSESSSLFLMLDYKKSAITIPRQILKIMGECLEIMYPHIKEMRYIKYYYDLKLHDSKSWTTPLRGVGLGNMNELFTLMQCVFGHLCKKAFNNNSLFFNDDAVYGLNHKTYRKETVYLMSFIRATGNILNLSKCVISEGTIFCEEYNAPTGFDYRKRQLLLLPVLGSLFCSNTATAKRYLYSIERGLVGTGYRSFAIEFLNILGQFYKNEFGKMDPFLPYHLGGWIDFSKSNFSCLVEFIVDPGAYLRTPNEMGHIPEIRRWIRYNLDQKNIDVGLLSSRAKISYRGEPLRNPYRSTEIFQYRDNMSDYLYDYSDILNEKDYQEAQDSCVNHRGLHNAKPNIKLGIEQKTKYIRRKIYREYKKNPFQAGFFYGKDALSLNRALRKVKGSADSPDLLSYPRCFIKSSWPMLPGRSGKIIVYKKTENTGRSIQSLRDSMASTIESIRDNRWYYRSDPFIFYDCWRRKKSGYFITEDEFPRDLSTIPKLPRDFRVFCPNAKLFTAELVSRTRVYPLEWSSETELISDFKMYQFKDTFELILPTDLVGEWRDLKKTYKGQFSQLRGLLSSMNLVNRKEYSAFLYAARRCLETESGDIEEPSYRVDEDILQVLENFEEQLLYTSIIKGNYSVEDLLEDEEALDLFSPDFSQEESDCSIEDFEVLDSEDSEEEDYNPDLNELRRMARSGRPTTF